MAHILIVKLPDNGRAWCGGCKGYQTVTHFLKINEHGVDLCRKCVSRLRKEVNDKT